ncbi:thiolase family protein [Peribacillus castrilensis]|uniref:acetyl-CoA C-acetyltransferase n=1 Tax=Peribacillus simplex TaxID=1478 RepID=A0AAN2TSM9_9BACI|nr:MULTISPECIES: thiolase family protein [Peribacillus]MCP1093501.1 thiolase family protein [Bacillaceae bacterium OS4b]MBD8590463.1 thiolase family protein [Peribacillus simplex]MCP1152747.1 thiolase family protein [Peribacillus frigoritolerans]MCT1388418.1 thiolase family protein [Peribacillus frigoritolerans]MEA3576732.1 thiolase family protein [Peribacillus frigoritolerans]
MSNVVIIDSVRTAIGKLGGALENVPADFLAAAVLDEVIKRADIPKESIDEVIMGQAKQSSDASNLARVASLRAGFPVEVPGYTVHRQCGSGIQAINSASQQIQSGLGDVIIAGGAESMSTAPYYMRNIRFGLKSGNGQLLDPNTESQPGSQPIEDYGMLTMGMTAENLAEKYSISRTEQDEFALRSQENARRAISTEIFTKEIVPYQLKTKKGLLEFNVDEHPRETSLEKLASLKPVFKTNGTVTAGNSSGRNDGASALILMSEEAAKRHGKKPKARVIAQAAAGVSPNYMGLGPVNSTLKALQMSGLKLDDIALIELNEAFSAQALAVIKELKLDMNKVNPNGGAIAMGHPIGATGAILATKLIHELERTGKRYGLVTLCIAGGLGISTIIENQQI